MKRLKNRRSFKDITVTSLNTSQLRFSFWEALIQLFPNSCIFSGVTNTFILLLFFFLIDQSFIISPRDDSVGECSEYIGNSGKHFTVTRAYPALWKPSALHCRYWEPSCSRGISVAISLGPQHSAHRAEGWTLHKGLTLEGREPRECHHRGQQMAAKLQPKYLSGPRAETWPAPGLVFFTVISSPAGNPRRDPTGQCRACWARCLRSV